MFAEIGHFALVLALAIALVQTLVPLYGAHVRDHGLMAIAVPAAVVQFVCIAVAFGMLEQAFIFSDFSIKLVADNSHASKPLFYKIAGVWGNHEGSMVLWVLILSLFGALVALFGNNLPDALKARVLAVQGSIGVAFLLFILITSNPFIRLDPAPFEGSGLNPLLQDPGLASHPPFLYMGYVGFSMAFSFAIAALIEGKVDASWARWVRPWTLLAWTALTIGIALGSWWAYYTLGWGGYWFWDPVENASLLHWLAGTALLHSAVVLEKRGTLKSWTVLLAILAFSLSLIGTFLVRSGVLTSVHAFANDPRRGFAILIIICLFIGGALSLYAWRAPLLKTGTLFAPMSREGALILNNLLLAAATAAVFIGTLYPLLLDSLGGPKISVGPPYFNSTFGPIMLPLLFVVPFGPFLAWKRADVAAAAQRLTVAALIALAVGIATYAIHHRGPWLAPLGIALGAWLIAGSFSETAYRVRLFRIPLEESLKKAWHLPRSAWGTALAHAGLGVTLIGIVGVTAWRQEMVTAIPVGGRIEIGDYSLLLKDVRGLVGPNYQATEGVFEVSENGAFLTYMQPQKRFFPVEKQETTKTAIHTNLVSDLYVVIGDRDDEKRWSVRVYYNPLVPLIWIGVVVMGFGGLISLLDRRLRVGAPAPALSRRLAAVQPAE